MLVFLCLAFFSCNSTKIKNVEYKDKSPSALGMVYDYSNQPLADAVVKVDGAVIARTDVQGRFIIDLGKIKKNSVMMTVSKDTFEEQSTEVLCDSMQIVYFRLPNAQHLLDLAESSLENHLLDESYDYVKRSLALSPERADILYFKAIVLSRQQQYAEAKEILRELNARMPNNKNIEDFITKLETY